MFKVTMHEETFAGWLQVIGLLFGAVGVILPATIIVLTPPRTMTVGALTVCALIFLFCVFAAIIFFVLSHLADVIHRAARRGFRGEQETGRTPDKARRTEVKTEPLRTVSATTLDRPQPSSKIAPQQKKTASPVPVILAKVKTAVEEPKSAPPQIEEEPQPPLPVLELSSPDDILSPDTVPASAPAAQAAPQVVDARGHSEAKSMFESIKTFIDMEMWHLAYQRAKELIRKHPESQEAARLKKNLDTFRKKAEEMLVAW
jgi:hypothetical protein